MFFLNPSVLQQLYSPLLLWLTCSHFCFAAFKWTRSWHILRCLSNYETRAYKVRASDEVAQLHTNLWWRNPLLSAESWVQLDGQRDGIEGQTVALFFTDLKKNNICSSAPIHCIVNLSLFNTHGHMYIFEKVIQPICKSLGSWVLYVHF